MRLAQVDAEDVPDYYTIIKNPMDLSTMQEKLYDGEYTWCVRGCSGASLWCQPAVP